MQLPGITLGQVEKEELYGTLGIRLRQGRLVRVSVDYGIKSITVGDTEYVGEFNLTGGDGIDLSEDADGTTISAGSGNVSSLIFDGTPYTGAVEIDSLSGIDFVTGVSGVGISSFIPDGYAVTSLEVDGTPYTGAVEIDSGDGIAFAGTATGFTISSTDTMDLLEILDVDVAEYNADADDEFLAVSYTEFGPVLITLPSSARVGKVYTVKDEAGNALENNITVQSENGIKIDDEDEYIITGDFDSITATFDGYGYMVY